MPRFPKPTLLLTPNGSHDRNGPVSPSIAGGVLAVQGEHGQAWQIDEATTNYVSNPRGIGTAHFGGGGTLDPSMIAPVDASIQWASLKTVTEANTAGAGMGYWCNTEGVAGPRTYASGIWVNDGGFSLLLGLQYWYNAWANAASTTMWTSGDGAWHFYELPLLNIPAEHTIDGMQFYVVSDPNWAGNVPSRTFWTSHPQVEEKSYLTPYADGSMGSGFTWANGANNGRSTRDAGSVQVPAERRVNTGQGEVVARVTTGNIEPWSVLCRIGAWEGTGGDGDYINLARGSDGRYSLSTRTNGAMTGAVRPVSVPEHEPFIVAASWTETSLRMEFRDEETGAVLGAYTASRTAPAGYVTPANPDIGIGAYDSAGSQSHRGEVESTVFFDRELTPEERDGLFSMDRAWTWAELAEPGTITNIVQRGTGAYSAAVTLWRANRYGNRIERIPVDMPVQGSITFNEDTLEKHILSLEINNPHRLTPFEDYLIPELTLTDAAGNRETRPKGHYVVTPPNTNMTAARFSGTVEARSVLWRLAVESLPDGLAIPPGVDFGDAARDIALGMDLQARQLALPSTGVRTKDWVYLTPGIKRLAAINQLYNTASYYTVWADDFGIITTMPYRDLQLAQPVRHYSTRAGDPVTIVPPVGETPEWGRLRNRITVRNIAPDREPIYASLDVTDRSSPVHRDNLGMVLAGSTIDDPDIPDAAAALKRCEVELANGASYYRKLTIRALLDLEAGAHDVLSLDVERHGVHYDGRWIRRMWAIQLRGVTALTTAEVYRIERWR